MYQKSRLESQRDHFVQTRQDAQAATVQLADREAEIARLDDALRNP